MDGLFGSESQIEEPQVEDNSVTSVPSSEETAAPQEETAGEASTVEIDQSSEQKPTAEGEQSQERQPDQAQKQPDQATEFMPGKFKTPEDMKKNWFEQASYIGKLQTKVKKLEDKLKEFDIDTEDEDEKIATLAQKKLEEKMGPTLNYINEVRVKQVKDEVLKTYPGFDFENNNQKIIEELRYLDEAYRNSDPVGALKRAVANILSSDENVAQAVRQNVQRKQKAFTEGTGPAQIPQKPQAPQDDLDDVLNFANQNQGGFLGG